MPNCFVPRCNSGYPKTLKKNKALNIPNPALFSAPKDNELRKCWAVKIKRHDLELDTRHKVCATHFLEEDLLRHDETLLSDGTVHCLPRKNLGLRKGAIPCIFPAYPKTYLDNVRTTRKFPKRRGPPITENRSKRRKRDSGVAAESRIEKTNVEENTAETNVVEEDTVNRKLLFFELLQKLPILQLPSNWIFHEFNDECVVFLFLDRNKVFDVTKRIVVFSDLKVQAFIKLKQVNIKVDKITSLDSIEELIQNINDVSTSKSR